MNKAELVYPGDSHELLRHNFSLHLKHENETNVTFEEQHDTSIIPKAIKSKEKISRSAIQCKPK